MDWDSKWGEFDNFISFARAEESSKKLPFSDLIIDNQDNGVDTGSLFSLSMGSNRNHASATKSSLSASVEPSVRDGGIQNSRNSMEILIKEAQVCGTSLLAEASVGAMRPEIGLKLGKRTYFKNTGTSSSVKLSTPTRSKSSNQNHVPRCVVEGCSVDLSSAKGYHRKHRVCEYHSKCFKVVISGVERRFCQQCSRFHNLLEFDDKKRSCRRRLYDHNARRRKPQLETFHTNSATLSSSFYGREQMSFQLINSSLCHSRQFDNSICDNGSSNSMFTITRGYSTKLGEGSKESINFAYSEVPTEHFGARSLLSTNYWDSGRAESVPVNYQGMPSATELVLHGVDENLPLSSYNELLLQGQQSSNRPNFYTTIGFRNS